MRITERHQPQFQGFCDWCGVAVTGWYSERRTIARMIVRHRRLHREQGRVGQTIQAVAYP